jgi:hypothetical protein
MESFVTVLIPTSPELPWQAVTDPSATFSSAIPAPEDDGTIYNDSTVQFRQHGSKILMNEECKMVMFCTLYNRDDLVLTV